MPTIEEILQYLGIDYADEAVLANVRSALEDAVSYMQGAIGANVLELLPEDPRVRRLLKIYTKELYDERGATSAKAGNAKREMVHSMEWQLRLALSAASAEAASAEAEGAIK